LAKTSKSSKVAIPQTGAGTIEDPIRDTYSVPEDAVLVENYTNQKGVHYNVYEMSESDAKALSKKDGVVIQG